MKSLTPPPAPVRLNDFPENTEDEILFEKDLGTASSHLPLDASSFILPFPVGLLVGSAIEQVKTIKLTIKGRWEKLFFTTIDVGEEFTHTIEASHGVTSSRSETTEVGADIGAKGDLGSISTKLRQVTQTTVTLTENQKETYQLKKTVKTRTTVCWWQEVLTFETSGRFSQYAMINPLGLKKMRVKIGSGHYAHEILQRQPAYPETSFAE